MSPLDRDLVRRKLAVIARDLEDLGAIEGLPLAVYDGDRIRQKATERLLQELVDAAVDINLHLIRVGGEDSPADHFTSFARVARLGVIPEELASTLAPASGLRNRIVHEYDRLDNSIVLRAVGFARSRFPEYLESVDRYLHRAGGS
jgi:uncharacterized protein YutE (UPF0331/DUF86 family)